MSATAVKPETIRPIRAFEVSVAAVQKLSPHFLRITFTGGDLDYFGSNAAGQTLDLRIKVMIPSSGFPLPDFGSMDEGWYQQWLAMDADTRGFMRTYTVRRFRSGSPGIDGVPAVAAELDVDFVLHLDGGSGPAALWAASAAPGDRLTLIGPDVRAGDCLGIEFAPGGASRLLLVGDETAVPAIAAILETLPAATTGHAILEVPCAEDFLDLATDSGIQISWLARGGNPNGAPLQEAVRRVLAPAACDLGDEPEAVDVDTDILWETPEPADVGSGLYAWIAGEAAAVRELRRYLVRDVGMDRNSVAFMGYWRLGKAQRS
ncbi:siderophore-interacting protein [Arthrobacter sp. 35W]|uniref:siderophore-interacting protein n=1 Tax=Arthrobacter sp. 35W TaxID=1132441 RepID=UPI000420974A|nr:siderophore-interacting protein [Arthrobacter sp. 35W]